MLDNCDARVTYGLMNTKMKSKYIYRKEISNIFKCTQLTVTVKDCRHIFEKIVNNNEEKKIKKDEKTQKNVNG